MRIIRLEKSRDSNWITYKQTMGLILGSAITTLPVFLLFIPYMIFSEVYVIADDDGTTENTFINSMVIGLISGMLVWAVFGASYLF